ncbi:MAG: hypothetical protein B7X59_05350 [Polaromonas sp. 39-63-203]|jgi:hypothetical protein|uniref:hypothetical protein n=1 Tax=Polaromonas sp. TaxID=1869339 RepID=UPI000BCE0819|nr:hypothetical protein [Polaromonas sp.]OYY52733.1 MAG: hypothetical protein B7Y54_05860 [Polaromonas sp. 35-63-240]OYY98544.1 MAG: hypothetical protein B7Y42_07210 [Polaromonas sp. 28-63-22]OYZ84513.1 MAG: hypothetical protein B7Y03_03415 [Polaromonas sp. 24-62-144]OZA98673.1 MAG: hypothetical protein B7X59_05350 [Polaromonas sp. 39-63-203]HQS32367.1 hypothetical protein [Polaromonas sp.]
MSLFDWFFSKSRERQGTDLVEPLGSPAMAVRPAPAQPSQRPAAPIAQAMDGRRAMRHARREQLYVAVREAMTRSGVLSATYKFKVLSLDQPGNEFLVMVDLSLDFDGITGQLGAMEALIVQHARARFGITVPTVYWRMDANIPSSAVRQAPAKPAARTPAADVAASSGPVTTPAPASHAAIRRDPIEAEEVAAFRQALLAASAQAPVAVAGSGSRKPARSIHSYALLTGFEDTEQTESAASPGLSKTQYGDLI